MEWLISLKKQQALETVLVLANNGPIFEIKKQMFCVFFNMILTPRLCSCSCDLSGYILDAIPTENTTCVTPVILASHSDCAWTRQVYLHLILMFISATHVKFSFLTKEIIIFTSSEVFSKETWWWKIMSVTALRNKLGKKNKHVCPYVSFAGLYDYLHPTVTYLINIPI